MPGLGEVFNLRIFNLKQERSLLGLRIILLGHTVPRASNLNCFAKGDLALVGLRLRGGVLGLAGGTFGQVGLVALALSVGQVVALVVVESETQFALVAPEVVAHEIGVLR